MVRLSIALASPDRERATPRAMPRRSAAAQVQERLSAHLPEVVKARPLERLRAQAREPELPPPPASRKSGSRRRVYSPLRSRDQSKPGYFAFSAAIAAAACSSGFRPVNTAEILPSGLMTNVVRSMPIYFLPYMLFSLSTPYLIATALSSSASRG